MDNTEGANAGYLTARATELVEKLRSQEIRAAVLKDSLRQYSIKVVLSLGQIVIYYSPKKNLFKYHLENVHDIELKQKIKACLEGYEQPVQADKVSSQAAVEERQNGFSDMVSAFQEYLKNHEVICLVKQKSDSPTVRIQLAVGSNEGNWGYLNVYYSSKKGIYPKFHEIREEGKKELLQRLWKSFTQPADDDLSEMKYYWSVLKPFGHLDFDFLVLAEALAEAWNRRMAEPLDAEELRYDFLSIEGYINNLFSNNR